MNPKKNGEKLFVDHCLVRLLWIQLLVDVDDCLSLSAELLMKGLGSLNIGILVLWADPNGLQLLHHLNEVIGVELAQIL